MGRGSAHPGPLAGTRPRSRGAGWGAACWRRRRRRRRRWRRFRYLCRPTLTSACGVRRVRLGRGRRLALRVRFAEHSADAGMRAEMRAGRAALARAPAAPAEVVCAIAGSARCLHTQGKAYRSSQLARRATCVRQPAARLSESPARPDDPSHRLPQPLTGRAATVGSQYSPDLARRLGSSESAGDHPSRRSRPNYRCLVDRAAGAPSQRPAGWLAPRSHPSESRLHPSESLGTGLRQRVRFGGAGGRRPARGAARAPRQAAAACD